MHVRWTSWAPQLLFANASSFRRGRPPNKGGVSGSPTQPWDPAPPARLRLEAASPVPFLEVELVRRESFQEQTVISCWAGSIERSFPTITRRKVRFDDKVTSFHADPDRFSKTTLVNKGLWDPNPARVADSYERGFHGSNYIVATGCACRKPEVGQTLSSVNLEARPYLIAYELSTFM
jgi:hypothetical protein